LYIPEEEWRTSGGDKGGAKTGSGKAAGLPGFQMSPAILLKTRKMLRP